jgi:hypothetical protein
MASASSLTESTSSRVPVCLYGSITPIAAATSDTLIGFKIIILPWLVQSGIFSGLSSHELEALTTNTVVMLGRKRLNSTRQTILLT